MKISASKLKKDLFSKQSLFYFTAFVLLTLEIVWIARSFSFLVKRLDQAFVTEKNSAAQLKFDTEGFLRLNLIRK